MESYGILSLVPPILTIILAFTTHNVIMALGLGALSGAIIIQGFNPFDGILHLVGTKIFDQIASPSNTQVLIVMACIGGFVKVLDDSGGAQAFARKMTKNISTPVKATLVTWLCGIGIFFTDSGNSLILGPLFSPIYKKLGICKEKLAYILDSTSAPICIIIPFVSWGAYIMSLIETSYLDMGISENAFTVLISALPFQFYAILTLLAVPTIALTKKDYGPMLKAQEDFNHPHIENHTAEVVLKGETSIYAITIPLIVLLTCISSLLLYFYMKQGSLRSEDIRTTLLISYVCASIGGGLYMKIKFNKSLKETLNLFIKGGESMIFIFYILILAWTLSSVCKDLHTGQYIAESIKVFISPTFFPMIIFFLGALISLSTGSSYGTFAILMPIALPVAHQLDASLYVTIGAILSGGLFGDHTSPISDTTILSSMGAGCDHLKHVKTQIVYSTLTASICAVCFIISTYFESYTILLLGFILQSLAIYFVTKIWGRNFLRPSL